MPPPPPPPLSQVLVMAGQLKRENPDLLEDVVLIRALRDSNLPKFLADDAILFKVHGGHPFWLGQRSCFSHLIHLGWGKRVIFFI